VFVTDSFSGGNKSSLQGVVQLLSDAARRQQLQLGWLHASWLSKVLRHQQLQGLLSAILLPLQNIIALAHDEGR
jgi:hypothetical protein